MKLDEDAVSFLAVCIVPLLLFSCVFALDENGKQQAFTKTYNKNLECRQTFKTNPDVCGPIPNIKDFQ